MLHFLIYCVCWGAQTMMHIQRSKVTCGAGALLLTCGPQGANPVLRLGYKCLSHWAMSPAQSCKFIKKRFYLLYMCLCLSIETNSKRKDTHSVGSDFSKESICSTSVGAGKLHRNLDCIYIYTRKYRPQPETQHSSQHFIQRLESIYLFLFWGSHPICSYERWKLHHRALGLHGLVYRLVQE